MLATEKWLKEEFIYFLSYAFVPLDESEDSKERFHAIWTIFRDKEDTLIDHWTKNAAFILATIEEKFPESHSLKREDLNRTDGEAKGKELRHLNKCE